MQMMFGRENNLPVDLIAGPPPGTDRCPVEYVEWTRDVYMDAYQFLRDHLKGAGARQRQSYNHLYKPVEISAGMWVWFWYPPKANAKLSTGWDGPYLVVKELSNTTLQIQKSRAHRLRTAHRNDCRPCELDSEDLPVNWLNEGARDEVAPTGRDVVLGGSAKEDADGNGSMAMPRHGDCEVGTSGLDKGDPTAGVSAGENEAGTLRRSHRRRAPPHRMDIEAALTSPLH